MIRSKLQQLMMGRNGGDQFSLALLGASILFNLLSSLLNSATPKIALFSLLFLIQPLLDGSFLSSLCNSATPRLLSSLFSS